mmetsp:Transcript_9365/g.14221  ORF Transcript_9365/g.14221 Transcript_9365/m.14221 type:complete len:343 (+) Transcript_9365:263-1291(+)
MGEPNKVTPRKPVGVSRIKNVASVVGQMINGTKKPSATTSRPTSPTNGGDKSARNTGLRRPGVQSVIGSGIKRPANSFIGKTETTTPAKARPGASGIKAPSEIKAPPARTRTLEEVKKSAPTPVKQRTSLLPTVKSLDKDEMDDIYKNNDPIAVSLDTRKKSGAISTVVPNKNSKQGKFFFTLKVKGEQIKVSEEAKRNNARETGKSEEPAELKAEDPIEKSLQSRVKAGSNTTVVPNKVKKEETVTKFKLVNDIPKAAEIKRDPTMRPPKQILERQETEKAQAKQPCQIDDSLQMRVKEGSVTSVVAAAKKNETVYSLKLSGPQPNLEQPKKEPVEEVKYE